jgi:hypothetical protein
MLKSYAQILQKDTLTVVCEPEKGHELAVNSLAIFGGVNGGYITISIGDFSMEHSISANGRIVFPFFMGVQENMAIKAIATNDDIRICASAEEFVVDGASDNPVNPDEPEPDEPVVPEYDANEPLTFTLADDEETGYIQVGFANNPLDDNQGIDIPYRYKNKTDEWTYKQLIFGQTNSVRLELNKGDVLQIRSGNYKYFKKYLTFQYNGKVKASGNLLSFNPSFGFLEGNDLSQLFRGAPLVTAPNFIIHESFQELETIPFGLCTRTFANCTYLEKAPIFSGMSKVKVPENCFSGFLEGCPGIKVATFPNLTELSISCFNTMYKDCTGLEKAELSFNAPLVQGCLDECFLNCPNLNEITVNFTDWGENATTNWVSGVSSTGIFYKPKDLPEEYGVNRIPEGWTVVNVDEEPPIPLTITNGRLIINTVGDFDESRVNIKYKVNNQGDWKDYRFGDLIDGDTIQVWNTTEEFSVSEDCYLKFGIIDGTKFSGNLNSLINFSKNPHDHCFTHLFYENTVDFDVEDLIFDFQSIGKSCFSYMFYETNIEKSPKNFTATQLGERCFDSMFALCPFLRTFFKMPKIQLAKECCLGMFSEAGANMIFSSTEEIEQFNINDILSSPYLAEGCYKSMFNSSYKANNWINPFRNIILPATTLAPYCYAGMFYKTYILRIELIATELVEGCYNNMFGFCKNLFEIYCAAEIVPSGVDCALCWLDFTYDNDDVGNVSKYLYCNYKNLPIPSSGADFIWRRKDLLEPFKITALETNSSVKFEASNSDGVVENRVIMYKTNTTNKWQPYNINETITLDNIDDCVEFWNLSKTLVVQEGGNNINIKSTGKIKASGYLKYLNESGYQLLHLTNEYALKGLFKDNHSLVDIDGLVFDGQSSDGNCAYMFQNCINLTNVTNLVLGDVADKGCTHMFDGCTGLKLIRINVDFYITGVEPLSYMFKDCINLKHIKVSFKSWGQTENQTLNWVENVSSNGTFEKPNHLSEIKDKSHIPQYWVVSDYDVDSQA